MNRKVALIALAVVMIISLSAASIAVAREIHSQQNQRACFSAGCRIWEVCNQGPGCPRFVQPTNGQPVNFGSTCAGGCCN